MNPRAASICIVTLGCPKNTVEGETIAGALFFSGYKLTQDINKADVALVHTCSFIADARKESVAFIKALEKLKKNGKLKKLIVSGCLSQSVGPSIEKLFPSVDCFIGTGELDKIGAAIRSLDKFYLGEPGGLIESEFPRLLSSESKSAYLRIAEGCGHKCSFCVIPKLRGRYVSRKMESIEAEALDLSKAGVRELVLIAQDTTSYGKDIYGKYALPKLIDRLSGIDEIKWIRVLYGYPGTLTNEFVNLFKTQKKLCRYIDIPLQHISDRVLALMQRPKGAAGLIRKLKNEVEGIGLRSTLITGYPGETEKDFRNMLKFVSEGHFDQLGVFEYSDDPSVRSFRMKGKIPQGIARERKRLLMEEQKKVVDFKNRKLKGSVLEVLAESAVSFRGRRFLKGRSYFQAPEIDNCVFFEGKTSPGEFALVKITGNRNIDLIGKEC